MPAGPRVGGEQDRRGPRVRELADQGESRDRAGCPAPAAVLPFGSPLTRAG